MVTIYTNNAVNGDFDVNAKEVNMGAGWVIGRTIEFKEDVLLSQISFKFGDTTSRQTPGLKIWAVNPRVMVHEQVFAVEYGRQRADIPLSNKLLFKKNKKYMISLSLPQMFGFYTEIGAVNDYQKTIDSITYNAEGGPMYVSDIVASSYPISRSDHAVYKNPFIIALEVEKANKPPSITLNTLSGSTLYENETFLIDGTAKDTDNNDIVNVRYQINNGTVVAIKTDISDGVTPIPFSRQLTFKGGKLYYNDVAVTGALTEGSAHTLKVWSEDDKGGKSEIAERTFYVVPNRPPKLTINPFESITDLINADKVTFTGTTSDPDGNDVVVSHKLNGGLSTEVYRGKDGDWSFDLLLSTLKDGENTIVVETVDSYNFKTSMTRKINKQSNLTPLAKSVQRYTLVPPAGTAQGVLMWIERDATQSLIAEISMTNGTEQEQFKPMTLDSSGPANAGTVEDFFKFRADVPAEKIAIKLSWTGDKPIFKVSGALTQ